MYAYDGENEVSRRKAEARAAGDRYTQLAGINQPRRRFVLGAWLSAIGRRLRLNRDPFHPANPSQRQADQPSR